MEIRDILDRWLPILSHKRKLELNYLIQTILDEIKLNIEKGTIEIVERIKEDLGDIVFREVPSSIISCIGMIICISYVSMVWYNDRRHVERAYHASLLYIDLDYTIDRKDDSDEYVKFIGEFIYSDLEALKSGKELQSIPDGHKNIKWYRSLIGRNINILNKVIELFNAEVDSSRIQTKTKSYKKIKRITVQKSKKTAEFICAILEIDNVEMIDEVIRWGYITQLIDDIYDIEDDMKVGILTMPVYELRKRGNIDKVVIEAITTIDSIPSRYNLLKVIFLYILTYVLTKFSKLITIDLMKIIDPYTTIDYRYNTDFNLMYNKNAGLPDEICDKKIVSI